MKKWFTFLLLAITMAGTFYPCCMEDDCAGEVTEEASHAHKNQGGNDDVCSPFFACGTCAPAVDSGYAQVECIASPVLIISHRSFYLVQLSSYTPSLFQPPKFA